SDAPICGRSTSSPIATLAWTWPNSRSSSAMIAAPGLPLGTSAAMERNGESIGILSGDKQIELPAATDRLLGTKRQGMHLVSTEEADTTEIAGIATSSSFVALAMASSEPALPLQTRLGNYQLVRLLAQGGMADVYLAYQDGLDREVAIKVLSCQRARDADSCT